MHPKDLFYSLGSSEDVWKRVVSTQKLPWSHEKPPDFFFLCCFIPIESGFPLLILFWL